MRDLWSALQSHSLDRGNCVALADARRVVAYHELIAAIQDRAHKLTELSIRVLAIALDNCVDWVLWDLAAARIGVVCVPVPLFFSDSQCQHIFKNAGVDGIVDPQGLRKLTGSRVLIPEGTAKITYTSGTTGEPKGVCLPHDGLEWVARSLLEMLSTVHTKNHVSILPLAVLLENVAGVYAALWAGCRIDLPSCIETNAEPVKLLQVLRQTKASTAILVPELLRGLMSVMKHTGETLPNLTFLAVGGSKVSPSLIMQARSIGLPVYEGYGLSECGSVVALNTPEHDRPGTVGRVLPHAELSIENGEIVVQNPFILGYLGGSCRGPLATGDLGALDDSGYLSISGRKKNVLITSFGRNISPEWVEAALLAQPEIAQTVVYGDGQPALSALLVAVAGTDNESLDGAIRTANSTLPEYARVREKRIVPPFTIENGLLTGTGRPKRQTILEFHCNPRESNMKKTNFFDRLSRATETYRQQLYQVPQLVDGLQGRISRETYIAYLTEAYHHVKHTVPLLMAMGARLPSDKQWLQEAVADYIDEEKGHEQWILNDIEAAGGDREQTRYAAPRLETQILVAYNYDYIARKNPIGFFGMVFMLESTSVQIATQGAESVQVSLGLPDDAFSYLNSHGSLDQEHLVFFKDLMRKIGDPQDQGAIIEVAQNTFQLFASVLRSIPHTETVRDVA